MDRLPLDLALTSVLQAQLDGASRPGLLAAVTKLAEARDLAAVPSPEQVAAVVPLPRQGASPAGMGDGQVTVTSAGRRR